jgi:carboxylesterase
MRTDRIVVRMTPLERVEASVQSRRRRPWNSRRTGNAEYMTAMPDREANTESLLDRVAASPTQPAALVLHGLGGGPYELQPLIDALEAVGVRVLAPIMPGHEGPGPVMPPSSWRGWLAAVESAFDQLAAGGGDVTVIGFSTGGTLALYLASRRPVARQVLLAPFLAIKYAGLIPVPPATYLRRLAQMIPNLPRRAPAVRDPEMRRWAANVDRYRTFNVNAAVSALELIELVKSLVPGITTPTLIIQGKLDSVVEPGNATWLYEQLGSTQKELVMLPRSDHLVALDREREKVIAMTRDFVLGRHDSLRGSKAE